MKNIAKCSNSVKKSFKDVKRIWNKLNQIQPVLEKFGHISKFVKINSINISIWVGAQSKQEIWKMRSKN